MRGEGLIVPRAARCRPAVTERTGHCPGEVLGSKRQCFLQSEGQGRELPVCWEPLCPGPPLSAAASPAPELPGCRR